MSNCITPSTPYLLPNTQLTPSPPALPPGATPRRYRLGSPSAAYAAAFAPMQRRLDMALRALRALREDPAAPPGAVQEKVLLETGAAGAGLGVGGSGSSRRYSVNVLDREAEFLEKRLLALHQVCMCFVFLL